MFWSLVNHRQLERLNRIWEAKLHAIQISIVVVCLRDAYKKLYKEKKSRTTRFPVKNKFEASNPDKVRNPGLLLKPDEPNLIIMAKPACGPSKRDKPVGMDED
ncbi:hypothetical protein L3X38_016864 [Prunus dulcis]|uniref:Uncharacterized protein n=1 Tax=Prunus dulcis TaxID=3755 RepID=A0AAD4W660_PRUDU|nr:hypothetical protein L3X38_016864 [Prunus dulcis]